MPRLDITFQFWSWLSGGVDRRTVDIAIANSPIKTAIIKETDDFSVSIFGYQPTIRFKRRGIELAAARPSVHRDHPVNRQKI
ncbi:hypothetical protein MJ391_26785 [Escherichia coli]|nr:hypothetical protein MJ391_26785 [Escherichia coli]